MGTSVFAFALTAVLFCGLSLQATSVPAVTLSGGNVVSGSGVPYPGLELGFRFTPSVNISVTALGTWDGNMAAIPAGTEVGLFGPGTAINPGALLASVSFGGGSTLSQGFAYVDVGTPVTLTAGTSYTILSYFVQGAVAPEIVFSTNTFNSDIGSVHFTNSYLPSPGLTYLGTVPGSLSDYTQYGPNFEFAHASAGVPEPSSGGLLVIGALMLLTLAQRKLMPAR